MGERPKVSIYWAAGCGGCEIAFLGINEKIIDFDANFELVFCPCLLDTKKKDLKAMEDSSIDITFLNGAIRTEADEEMALLLRKKSQIMVAFGSCSCHGGIPGLANFSSAEDIIHTTHLDCITADNPQNITPQLNVDMPEGTLTIPKLKNRVLSLAEVVPVDYYIPGCPPEAHQILNVIEMIKNVVPLPPKGSIIGAGKKAVCDECTKVKNNKLVSAFYRTYELIPDPKTCLLEQGIICLGPATSDGCGALCPQVNMPCTGCYGPPEGVLDQGAKMIAALGSIIDINKPPVVADCGGTLYKYSLANSILKGKVHCSE